MNSLFYSLWYIQIIFESLPISSSGHLELIQRWLVWYKKIQNKLILTEQVEHIMHIPTLFVVGAYMLEKWGYLLLDISKYAHTIIYISILVFTANACTGLMYYFFKILKARGKLFMPLWLGFLVTALLLLSLYSAPLGVTSMPSLLQAALIGTIQGLALLPGISRLASTCVAGIWLGLTPLAAFVFSCTIQFPLLLVAVVRGLWSARKSKDISLFYPVTYSRTLLLILSTFLAYLLLQLMAYSMEYGLFAQWGWYMLSITILAFANRKYLKSIL
ncbi:undecaprenyl-diphosphate phosphatase [Candidatus Dependentiae bacterium]|nr:undecaprenyl-diphosphate phosphatase [Candidatus Dependentiae bacterium]